MIHKNTIDTAEYEYYVTTNGIKALTISDPTLDICSCAVSVRIGSFDDPFSTPGLAHFLEHMLFMGTKKYPGENEFLEFINQHNGSSNAVTTDEATIYFFDIMPDAFETGIDMFADFFRDPLFKKSSVEREISAVNSEFINGLNRDDWRNYRMTGVFSKKDTPASKFNVGNNRFLKKDGIWEEVQEFWRLKYSSEVMCVVIYGNESTSKLKKYLDLFNGVPKLGSKKDSSLKEGVDEVEKALKGVQLNKLDFLDSISKSNWRNGFTIFNEEYLNRWIMIQPIVDKKKLIVYVTVPPEYDIFENNPYLYISNIFHRRDEKGFIYHLKNKGLAFSADFEISNNIGYSMVTITISLSIKGSEAPLTVLEYLVSYLRNIKADRKEYQILKEISTCIFEYNERLDPSEQSETLVEKMQFYPVENLLNSEYIFEEFKRDQIEDLLLKISDFNKWLVFYITKDHEFDLEEEIYGIKYSVGDRIFNKVQGKCEFSGSEASTEEDRKDKDWISVESMRLLSKEEYNMTSDAFKKEVFENGKITYLFNDSYRVPKVCIGYLFRLSNIAENFVDFMFLVRNAEDVFSKKYDNLLYKTQVSIASCVKYYGIEFKFEGFSHGVAHVSKLFFDTLFNCIDTSRHEIIREEINDELLSEKNLNPYRLLPSGLKLLKIPGYLSPSQKIEKLQDISLKLKMPRIFYVEIFAVGNITYEEVVDMFKSISDRQEGVIPYEDINLLEEQQKLEISTTDSRNNACGMYYYSGKYGCYRDTAITHLIVQSCQEMFFDHLRTKEELGYIVFAGIEHLDKLQYIFFLVQSEKDTKFLESRIGSFVDDLGEYFEHMTEEDFNSFKKAVVASFEEKYKNFSSYSNSLWLRYLKGVTDINYEDSVISAVNAVTKRDIVESNILRKPYVVKASAH